MPLHMVPDGYQSDHALAIRSKLQTHRMCTENHRREAIVSKRPWCVTSENPYLRRYERLPDFDHGGRHFWG